jgi:hypothetical protein
MRKIVSISFFALLAAVSACTPSPTSESPRGEDVSCGPSVGVDEAGKPTCPAGCYWDGQICKKDRGVIILQGKPTAEASASAAPTSAPVQ